VPDTHDRDLPRGTKPQMAMVQQEIDAVLLRLNRIIDGALAEDRELRHTQLMSAGRTCVGTHFAGHRYRAFHRELLVPFPCLEIAEAPYERPHVLLSCR